MQGREVFYVILLVGITKLECIIFSLDAVAVGNNRRCDQNSFVNGSVVSCVLRFIKFGVFFHKCNSVKGNKFYYNAVCFACSFTG